MKRKKWSKEMIEIESKKYTSRFQFQKNSKYAYNKALKKGWLDEFVWLKTPTHKENNADDKTHCVYAYFDKENKSVYVGRTNNIKVRHHSHNKIQYKNKKYDTVKAYFAGINKQLPLPVVLLSNLTLIESQYYEDFFIKHYKNNKWKVLNKGKTGIGIGSVGGFVQKLTYDYCKAIALTCKTRKEFERKDRSAYRKSCQRGWVNEFIPNKVYKERSYDECFKIAKQYNSITDFRKNDLLIYNYCKKHNWVEKFDWLLKSRKHLVKENNPTSKKYKQKYKRKEYTYEEWYKIAIKFKTKQEFRKAYPNLVSIAYNHGWFERSNLFRPLRRQLTKEKCLEIANNYQTLNQLRRSDESVYQYLLKNNLFEKTNLKYTRNLKIKNLTIEFYKNDLSFPLSGNNIFLNKNRKSIKRVLKILEQYINKKTNVLINKNDKNKIFISNLISFCKLEGIDYNQILEIEVIQKGEIFQIIVNKGINEDVKILEIN